MTMKNTQKAYILAKTYNLSNYTDTKYEPFFIDDDIWVFRLANRPRSDNILVKFDPNEVTP